MPKQEVTIAMSEPAFHTISRLAARLSMSEADYIEEAIQWAILADIEEMEVEMQRGPATPDTSTPEEEALFREMEQRMTAQTDGDLLKVHRR